jgi:hypothetical protein
LVLGKLLLALGKAAPKPNLHRIEAGIDCKISPGSLLISYSFVGAIVSMVMFALGEMATWLPMGEGFAGYATRFCDPGESIEFHFSKGRLVRGLRGARNEVEDISPKYGLFRDISCISFTFGLYGTKT